MAKIDRDAAIAVMFRRYHEAAKSWNERGKDADYGAMVALDRAGNELAKLPAEEDRPRWIPCAEALPTRGDHKDGVVLACNDNGQIRFNACMDGRWVVEEPIAWMPLPEPYEEEQDEQGAD